MGGKDLLVLPPDRLSGGKGLGHIQQPLVPAAPEAECYSILYFPV